MKKKIILGTSDAWSMIRLSHRPSDPAYYIVNWRISELERQASASWLDTKRGIIECQFSHPFFLWYKGGLILGRIFYLISTLHFRHMEIFPVPQVFNLLIASNFWIFEFSNFPTWLYFQSPIYITSAVFVAGFPK